MFSYRRSCLQRYANIKTLSLLKEDKRLVRKPEGSQKEARKPALGVLRDVDVCRPAATKERKSESKTESERERKQEREKEQERESVCVCIIF